MYLGVLDLISLFFNKGIIVSETGKYYKADCTYCFDPVYQNERRINVRELSKNMILRFVYEFTYGRIRETAV